MRGEGKNIERITEVHRKRENRTDNGSFTRKKIVTYCKGLKRSSLTTEAGGLKQWPGREKEVFPREGTGLAGPSGEERGQFTLAVSTAEKQHVRE